jgi:hypothetical protein
VMMVFDLPCCKKSLVGLVLGSLYCTVLYILPRIWPATSSLGGDEVPECSVI